MTFNVVLIYLVLLIYEVTRPGYQYSAATHFGGVTDWYQNQGYREPGQNVLLDYNRFQTLHSYKGVFTGHSYTIELH